MFWVDYLPWQQMATAWKNTSITYIRIGIYLALNRIYCGISHISHIWCLFNMSCGLYRRFIFVYCRTDCAWTFFDKVPSATIALMCSQYLVSCVLLTQVWQHCVEKEQVCRLYNKHRKNTAIKCSRWLATLAFLPNICQDFCPYLALTSSRFFRESSGECSFCRLSTKFDRLEVLVWQEDVNDRWIPAGLHHTARWSTDRAQTLT